MVRTSYIATVSLVLLFLISLTSFSFWWDDQQQDMYEETFKTREFYSVFISTTGTLDNVTFYFPCPLKNDISFIEPENMNDSLEKGDSSWEYDFVDTEHGRMLSMSTETITSKEVAHPDEFYMITRSSSEPNETKVLMPYDPSEKTSTIYLMYFIAEMPANRIIDTRDPVDKEMVLSPKNNISQKYDVLIDAPESYGYDSMVYAEYSTSPGTNVTITIELYGSNSWTTKKWNGNSHTSNHYDDCMSIDLSGSQNGWVSVAGLLKTGMGVYREDV